MSEMLPVEELNARTGASGLATIHNLTSSWSVSARLWPYATVGSEQDPDKARRARVRRLSRDAVDRFGPVFKRLADE